MLKDIHKIIKNNKNKNKKQNKTKAAYQECSIMLGKTYIWNLTGGNWQKMKKSISDMSLSWNL